MLYIYIYYFQNLLKTTIEVSKDIEIISEYIVRDHGLTRMNMNYCMCIVNKTCMFIMYNERVYIQSSQLKSR